MSVDTRVALVTGASRGIGKAIAIALAEQGVAVYGTATSVEGAAAITEFLKEKNLKGEGLVCQLQESSSIPELFDQLNSRNAKIDILVNNAAITRDNLLLRMKDDEWQSVIDVNLTATFSLTKACLRDMVKSRWGRVINVSSIVGVSGNAGQANYAAAKAGVIGFTKSLAQEIASRNITANVVAPGFIETDMTRALTDEQRKMILSHIPMGKIGTVEDVAACVAFLSTEAAGYITGQTFHVNGGMLMP